MAMEEDLKKHKLEPDKQTEQHSGWKHKRPDDTLTTCKSSEHFEFDTVKLEEEELTEEAALAEPETFVCIQVWKLLSCNVCRDDG